MGIRRIKNTLRFYKLLAGYVIKTLVKPFKTSFEVNGVRVNRFRYIRFVCKGFRKTSRLIELY